MNYLFKYNKYDLPLIFKNRGFSIEFQICDDNDVPIDITSYTISSSCRTELNHLSDLICHFAVDKTTPTMGIFTLGLASTVSATISQTYGYYDVKVKDGVAPEADTYIWGQVNFQGVPTA